VFSAGVSKRVTISYGFEKDVKDVWLPSFQQYNIRSLTHFHSQLSSTFPILVYLQFELKMLVEGIRRKLSIGRGGVIPGYMN